MIRIKKRNEKLEKVIKMAEDLDNLEHCLENLNIIYPKDSKWILTNDCDSCRQNQLILGKETIECLKKKIVQDIEYTESQINKILK